MNASPLFPEPMTSRALLAGRKAKTVGTTASPASSEAELLPSPAMTEFRTMSSRALM